jgi:opacity protein-like surface antigen
MTRDIMHSTTSGSKRRGSLLGFAVLAALAGGIAGLMALPGQAMAGDQGGITLTPAQRARLGNAQAADLPYKAPVMAVRVYSWTGFYGGIFGGGGFADPKNYNLSADPTAVNTVSVGPAANGGYPIYSNAYNNLANGPFTVGAGPTGVANAVTSVGFTGGGQVKNGVVAGGANCVDAVGGNCVGPSLATTNYVAFQNPGTRTDSMLPTSLNNSSQMAGLIGVEIGGRKQFDNNVVLGIGADIMAFMHGGTTNYNSSGAFSNSNGFTANSSAQLCTQASGVGGICAISAAPSVNGTSTTINTGSSTSSLTVNANPNWIGTVRGSIGYAFDRLLIFGSGGLAYSDGKMNVTGSYNDKVTSSCNGTASSISSGGLGLGSGSAYVGYQCGAAALSAASVSQTTTTSVTYSGNHGGMLTGFAAGAGMAYALSDHVSLTLEGMYYNLGTERVTVTGTGTQTSTTTTTPINTPVGTTSAPATVTATATPFTVSKMIDGAIFKGGIQFKF